MSVPKSILINKTCHDDMSELVGILSEPECMFSVQMLPLSLPNDLNIKSCRFPVVNLPRGTEGTCRALLSMDAQIKAQILPLARDERIVLFWNYDLSFVTMCNI